MLGLHLPSGYDLSTFTCTFPCTCMFSFFLGYISRREIPGSCGNSTLSHLKNPRHLPKWLCVKVQFLHILSSRDLVVYLPVVFTLGMYVT